MSNNMGNTKAFIKKYSPRKEVTGSSNAASGTSCLLVVSSKSGFGNAARLAPKVAQHLSQHYERVVVVPTQQAQHAREILLEEENLSSYTVAVILGGDGAFSEAANGMLCREDNETVTLAHYPGGSGCAIAGNTLGCWKGKEDYKRACEIIGKGKTSKMDVMEIECNDGQTRYCTSCLAGGINCDTVDLTDNYRWTYYLFGPTFRYIIGVMKSMTKYGATDSKRLVRYTINDGEEIVESTAMGLAVYNSGRVMKHAAYTDTTIDSGDLGLVAEKTYLGLGKQLKYVQAVGEGNLDLKNKDHAAVHFARTVKSVKVEQLDQLEKVRPMRLAFDGEKGAGNNDWMQAPFTARVLPKKIDIIVA